MLSRGNKTNKTYKERTRRRKRSRRRRRRRRRRIGQCRPTNLPTNRPTNAAESRRDVGCLLSGSFSDHDLVPSVTSQRPSVRQKKDQCSCNLSKNAMYRLVCMFVSLFLFSNFVQPFFDLILYRIVYIFATYIIFLNCTFFSLFFMLHKTVCVPFFFFFFIFR